MRRTRRGFLRGLALDGRDVVPGRVPDVLDRVVVGRVRRRMDRRDALQQLPRLVEVGQRFRVVESGVVRDDRDLAGLGFSLEQVRCEDCLLGVLVALDWVQRDPLAGQREGAEERLGRLLPVHGQFGALSSGGLHAAGLGLVLQAGLVCRADLPALIQQALDLGLHLRHASGDGFLVVVLVERVGQFEAQPAQAQEQPVRGIRLVLDVEQDLHDVTYRRDVPELGMNTGPGGRPGQDGLEFFLLCAGEFRRVLIPRMAGQDRAHPGGLPVDRPFLHRPLSALNRLSDDVHVDATGGVQDRLCLHPHQHMIVGTLPPPDQDGCFFRGDLDLHAPIISETAQEIHEKYGSVSCQP